MPLVSVLIPAYRAHKTIVRAVRSICAQTYIDWEIIIASDDQTDYLASLAGAGICDDRISMVMTGNIGSGDGTARNKALEAAQGTLIATLDADDAYATDRLKILIPLAERFGVATDNTGVCYVPHCITKRPFPGETDIFSLSASDILSPRIPLFPVFHRDYAGNGWPSMAFAADVLFNLALLCRVSCYVIYPRSLYWYYKTAGSVTHSAHTPYIAEIGYKQILTFLTIDTETLSDKVRAEAIIVFSQNCILNRIFKHYLDQGYCNSLEDFLDRTDNGKASWLVPEIEEIQKNLSLFDPTL